MTRKKNAKKKDENGKDVLVALDDSRVLHWNNTFIKERTTTRMRSSPRREQEGSSSAVVDDLSKQDPDREALKEEGGDDVN